MSKTIAALVLIWLIAAIAATIAMTGMMVTA